MKEVRSATDIKVGMTLIEVQARREKQSPKTVKRVNKKFIITQDGQKYDRSGYYIYDDSGKRNLYTRLHIPEGE